MKTMISTLLIFPIIACILALLIKNKKFNTFLVTLYAIVHSTITAMLAMGHGDHSIPYFAVDGTNLIFLIVLSLVFLMVAIYNAGYVKNFEFPDKKISHYSFMILIFVLSMTGTLLSTVPIAGYVFHRVFSPSEASIENAIRPAFANTFSDINHENVM